MRATGGSDAILASRRAFLVSALARTGGAGFPAGCRTEREVPDLVTTALILPDAAHALSRAELARIVGWMLTHQGPGGGFVPRDGGRASTAASTAHAHAALLGLQLRGLANARWIEARRRAAGWIAALAEGHTPAPDVAAHELGAIAGTLAVTVGTRHAPQLYHTLDVVSAELSHRLARERAPERRLWLARGLLQVFNELGSRGHLEQVVAVVRADGGGATPSPGEAGAAPGHDALLVRLACEIGVPEHVAGPATRLARWLSARSGSDEPIPTTEQSDPLAGETLAIAFAHEALFRYAESATGRTQVPIWIRSGEGELEASPVTSRAPDTPAGRGTERRRGRVHAVFLPHEPPGHACPRLRVHGPLSHADGRSHVSYEPGADVTRRHVLLSTAAVERADVIIHQRLFPAWLLGAAALPRIERSGAAVVYDLDDLLLEMPPDHPRADAIAPALPEIQRALATADLVTTSTGVLARRLEHLGASRVVTIPNAVDPALWPEPRAADTATARTRPVHLACIGSPTHRADYTRIAGALGALFERHPGRLRLSIWGDAPPELAEHPAVSVDPTYVSSYAEYAEKLRTSDIDIGLVPLAPNAFNESKSAIKWLELSAAGKAGVFARTGQYAEWVRDGETGLLAGEDPGEWCRAIEALLDDPERRLEIGRRARARVLEAHGIDDAAARWVDAIDEAHDRRANRRRSESLPDTPSGASRNPIRIPTAELLSA